MFNTCNAAMDYKWVQQPPIQMFNPYVNNGGTVVAIAGSDYAIIGSDSRLSEGRSVATRYANKLFELSDLTVFGCSGCWCDVLTFTRIITARMRMYKHQNNKVMSTEAVAQMISTALYYKRFFPYYISSILAGLDASGKGCLFNYDAIGHCERVSYEACGTGCLLASPMLDNKVGLKNMENVIFKPIDIDDALNVIKDAFIVVAERDIFTGDSVDINVITEDGIERSKFDQIENNAHFEDLKCYFDPSWIKKKKFAMPHIKAFPEALSMALDEQQTLLNSSGNFN
ncbi:hypothetical protein RN001_002331 [Aquatica leii]|uniref:Proteasome subunit beta n=1 Tax=Aquatica leii TaxID=1421715 RepID=A0AAN7PDA0_9COLE|nr:hypothetical protein RN001_002331 [Aquatica leii]